MIPQLTACNYLVVFVSFSFFVHYYIFGIPAQQVIAIVFLYFPYLRVYNPGPSDSGPGTSDRESRRKPSVLSVKTIVFRCGTNAWSYLGSYWSEKRSYSWCFWIFVHCSSYGWISYQTVILHSHYLAWSDELFC